MRDFVRFLTMCCVIGIIAAMGGYEQRLFGLTGWAIRTAIFFALLYVSIVVDDVLTKRKKAHRAATRKAKQTKYELICHE